MGICKQKMKKPKMYPEWKTFISEGLSHFVAVILTKMAINSLLLNSFSGKGCFVSPKAEILTDISI